MSSNSRQQQIEELLAEEPNDPELRYMLAMEHAGQGNDLQALPCFQELLRLAPEYAPGYHQLGRTLQRLGRFLEAGQVLEQGIAVAREKFDHHAAGEMQDLLDHLTEA